MIILNIFRFQKTIVCFNIDYFAIQLDDNISY